jgi:hypothetical protein
LQQSENDKYIHAAVDLSQFRNEKVGEGYQAKHVIRQKEAAPSKASGIVDMSQRKKESKQKVNAAAENDGLKAKESYLACRGMRDFIREVNKILENS